MLIHNRLLKHRRIKTSRPCAIATAQLLRRVVEAFRLPDPWKLIERVQHVGRRLIAAQPRELVVGNIVRRVLGLIRDEAEEDREGEASSLGEGVPNSNSGTPRGLSRHGIHSPLQHELELGKTLEQTLAKSDAAPSQRPTLAPSHTFNASTATTIPMATSMFNLLSHPLSTSASPTVTPGTQSPVHRSSPGAGSGITTAASTKDIRADVLEGIDEIVDELHVVTDQIAAYAPEHIHSNEIILTHGASRTVQRFLLKAAQRRKFTVIHAEGYPNAHAATHALVAGKPLPNRAGDEAEERGGGGGGGASAFAKPLIAAGIAVVLIPDAAVFALMARVNKVILGTNAVLANGGLIAAAGAKPIALAARMHRTPVVVVSGVYKLSPVYPFDVESLIDYGDSKEVLGDGDKDLVESGVEVENPVCEYVPPELLDLYITNL